MPNDPQAHEQHAHVTHATDFAETDVAHTQSTEVKFNFRKSSEKDELGQEIKRPPYITNLPYITYEGLKAGLKQEHIRDFILDLVNGEVKAGAKAQIDEKSSNDEITIDFSKLALDKLATVTKAERKGREITVEMWAEFKEDYVTHIIALTGAPTEKVQYAAEILTGRLTAKIKSQKKAISFLKDQLNLWATDTQNPELLENVFPYLDDKLSAALNADSESLMDNLQ